jgi:hypothetical protein
MKCRDPSCRRRPTPRSRQGFRQVRGGRQSEHHFAGVVGERRSSFRTKKRVAHRSQRQLGAAHSSQCRVLAHMASTPSCRRQTRSQWPSPQPSASISSRSPRHRGSRAHPNPAADQQPGRGPVAYRRARDHTVRSVSGRDVAPRRSRRWHVDRKRVAWRVTCPGRAKLGWGSRTQGAG